MPMLGDVGNVDQTMVEPVTIVSLRDSASVSLVAGGAGLLVLGVTFATVVDFDARAERRRPRS
jgi:hypothetical protein